jgi:hypothetical protein
VVETGVDNGTFREVGFTEVISMELEVALKSFSKYVIWDLAGLIH